MGLSTMIAYTTSFLSLQNTTDNFLSRVSDNEGGAIRWHQAGGIVGAEDHDQNDRSLKV